MIAFSTVESLLLVGAVLLAAAAIGIVLASAIDVEDFVFPPDSVPDVAPVLVVRRPLLYDWFATDDFGDGGWPYSDCPVGCRQLTCPHGPPTKTGGDA